MSLQNSSNKKSFRHERAQAIAEFAITLPILMVMLVGIFEAGRMIFTYAAVNNASREAARYASAVGLNNNNRYKYKDCASIRQVAKNSTFFLNIPNNNIVIEYTRPQKDASGNDVVVSGVLSETTLSYVCDQASGEDPQVLEPESGDRVRVTVRAAYSPMISLIPIRSRTFESISSRTILGIFELDN